MGHVIESALAFSFKLSARARETRTYSLPLHKMVLERIEKGDARGAQAAMLRLLENARNEIEIILAEGKTGRAARAQRKLRRA